MGRDKALLEWHGRSLIERALEVLEPVAGERLLASGSAPRYAELGVRCVLDESDGGGPLAGLAAGLAASRGSWLAVIACDMPRCSPELLTALLERAAPEGFDGAVYEIDGRVEPLCGVYHKRCLTAVRASLAEGRRRMIDFWMDADTRMADAPRVLRVAPADPRAFTNLNTPEDLAREADAR